MERDRVTLSGAAAAAALLPQVDPAEAEPDFLRALQDGADCLAALLLDGEPVGAVQAAEEREAFLYVYILPAFRGRGLGRAAADKLEERLRRAGAEAIVTAYPAENRAAAAFADHLGYRPAFRSDQMVYSGPALPLAPVPVRPYRAEDYGEAHALYAEAFHRMRLSTGCFPDSVPRPPSEAERRAWAENAGTRLIWAAGEEIAGYAHLDPEDGEISSVAVKPALQGRGIGRKFVTYLVNYLLARGAPEVSLWCVEGNVPARRLYDSLGFREVYRCAYGRKALRAGRGREEDFSCP